MGWTGKTSQTLPELGEKLGVSGERVRQLQVEALVWLRHPAHSQELRALLRRHSQQEYEWAEEMAQAWLRRRGGRTWLGLKMTRAQDEVFVQQCSLTACGNVCPCAGRHRPTPQPHPN